MFKSILTLWCGLLLACSNVYALDVTGAGASLPYPVYAKWAAAYHKISGHRVNFQSIGSGGGQQQIIAGTVDFGASDDPMDQTLLDQHNLIQFPAVIGAIVPIINVPGIGAGELKLTGSLLAQIYLGQVHRWDDPAIRELNPDLKLPPKEIVVVHRADGSGTTYHWTKYLSQVSAEWRSRVGAAKAVKWPTGHGGKGNEGVSAYVSQLDNSIGYVEFAFAHQNHMAWASLENMSGNFVEPGLETFMKTLQDVDWQAQAKKSYALINLPGADSWPIAVATFIILPKQPRSERRQQAILDFFSWAWSDAKTITADLDFVPVPDHLIVDIKQLWHQNFDFYQDENQ